MTDEWSDEELKAAVDAYNQMARNHAERKPYSKKAIYSELAQRFGRSAKAFEYRMQNVSAVLDGMGEPWVPGLKPASNVGSGVTPRIETLLKATVRSRKPSTQPQPEYKEELPAIRDWLIEVARRHSTVRYGDVMNAFGLGFRNIRRVMDYLGHESENLDEPIITALIVNANGRCSDGFEKEFGITDDIGEREKLYVYWAATSKLPNHSESAASLTVRAARFVSVEARPDQAKFRRGVFLAHNGKCAISGCSVVAALDAAHKRDRDWRKGHNRANDGYLLRKDLHALYDCGLLQIGDDGSVRIDATINEYYGDLEGRRIGTT